MISRLLLLSLLILSCGVDRGQNRNANTTTNKPPKDIQVEEPVVEEPAVSNCPNKDNSIGVRIGDTFPSVRYPNADGEAVPIKSLCGNKAILVVSATEWCGACIAELNYLAIVAADWRERGGEIYYTLFEDGSGQPTGRATLERFEKYLLETTGDVPFRILADPIKSLPNSLNGSISLPLAWALDKELIITNFSEGTNAEMVTGWMENLLNDNNN